MGNIILKRHPTASEYKMVFFGDTTIVGFELVDRRSLILIDYILRRLKLYSNFSNTILYGYFGVSFRGCYIRCTLVMVGIYGILNPFHKHHLIVVIRVMYTLVRAPVIVALREVNAVL